jgi:Tol biopolymer transport system component
VVAAALVALTAGPLYAQYVPFGKNKVQYTPFEWHILSGPRVDVYFYPEEEELARAALSYAEESYDSLMVLFRHRPFRRVPLFIYSSHQHFEQTNLTPSFLPEGVAGFTEYLKRRIALPFNGSYAEFQHTIKHELVHFFQLSKISRVFDMYPRWRGPGIPLWWSEGLAEAWSSEQDTQDEMFVRNMVLSGQLPSLPQITYDRSFLAYPLGGQIHHYLAERFGSGRVADFYDNIWKYSSFEQAFFETYGITLEELSREWAYELERQYFPIYEERSPVIVGARPMLSKFLPIFKPTIYDAPGGTPEVFFMSPRDGFTTIYRMQVGGGDGSVRGAVQGDKSEEFESLHFYSSRIDVSPEGQLVFVSKYLERDALQIYDLTSRKIVGRYQFEEIVAMSSPAWSPDGRKVVFSGLSIAGPSDLYVIDFDTQEHYPITSDLFLENDPDWSSDGRYIVFSSDRTAWGDDGSENLFLYDRETHETRYLTYGPWKDLDPRFSPDGRLIVFTSDRTGVHDLYLVDLEGSGGRLTNYTGDVFDADWLPDGSGLVFSAYEDRTFNLFFKELGPPGAMPDEVELIDEFGPPGPGLAYGWEWKEVSHPVVSQAEKRRYRTKYGLDFAAGQAAFAPGYGSAQGAQFLASDMLGDHLIHFSIITQNFSNLDDIFDSFAGQLTYLNLSRRVNWGVGAFRFNGRFIDAAYADTYQEKTFGGFFVASYPFSVFRRLELQSTLEYSDRVDVTDFFITDPITDVDDLFLTRKGIISTNAVSYVKDNTLWLPTGPIDGVRYNLTLGLATDLTHARAESFTILGDWRRYIRTGMLSAWSIRVFGYYSDGAIPSRIAMGGPYTLRLYPFLGFIGSRAWLINNEWRFALMHGFALGFPWGTWRFPGIQAAPFVDIGGIWQETRALEGSWGSYGVSFRMAILFPIVLRLDVGRRFTIGQLPTFRIRDFDKTEVDFFFGFNY